MFFTKHRSLKLLYVLLGSMLWLVQRLVTLERDANVSEDSVVKLSEEACEFSPEQIQAKTLLLCQWMMN